MQAGPGFQFGGYVSRRELSPALMWRLGRLHPRFMLGCLGWLLDSVDGLSLETESVTHPQKVYVLDSRLLRGIEPAALELTP